MLNLFTRSFLRKNAEHLKHRLTINGENLFLEFQSETAVKKRGVSEALDGHKYRLNNVLYTDEESFRKTELEQLSEDVSINEDSYGRKVLYVHTSVPTFDSGDREWDSSINEYLMFDGSNVNLIKCRRGYRISSITIYVRLISASENTRSWLKRLGFPENDVIFTDAP